MTGWDWLLIGALVGFAVTYIGAWLWSEVEAEREEREELRRRLREPAPRLRVLPGGES